MIFPLLLHDSVTEDIHLEVEFTTKHNDYFYKAKVLEKMTELDLTYNMLTGIIPSQIGDLQQTKEPSIYLIITCQVLFQSLFYNNLSGKIPYELTQLNFLSIFYMSYNNLYGTPPITGQLTSMRKSGYVISIFMDHSSIESVKVLSLHHHPNPMTMKKRKLVGT
jgi:hypothetical protein